MRSKLTRHSIQYKLIYTFLLLLLPLVCTSLFSNFYSKQTMIEQITARTSAALRTTLEYVDQFTKNMDQQTLLISTNPNLTELWSSTKHPLQRGNLYDIHVIQQQLSDFISVNDFLQEALIIHGTSGTGVSTLRGGLNWPEVERESWFQAAVAANGGLVVYDPNALYYHLDREARNQYMNESHIYFIRLLDVFTKNMEPNVMVIVVEKSSFRNIIQHLAATAETNITLLYNDQLLLNSDAEPARADKINSNKQLDADAQNFIIREDLGLWSIILEQPRREIFEQPERLQLLTYAIIGLSIILALSIGWFVYNEITKPLQKMLAAFRSFSAGKVNVRIEHQNKDEFGYLMDAFNRMSIAQQQLIENDYEKELRLARSEFSLLQSQINPHFLYNTLDSIYSVAVQKQIDEISEMVINLAQFFRFSLGKGRDSFTLEETIQHLMYYIRVQQIRTEQFAVDIKLDDNTKELSIIKLILQPIVENAIVHGIGKSVYGGDLSIHATMKDHFLWVSVQDTGVGMSVEQLHALQTSLSQITSFSYRYFEQTDFTYHYGLKNVKSRLKLYYGDDADVIIDSTEHEGTTVSLKIPLLEVKSE